jgi:hypothetical protein
MRGFASIARIASRLLKTRIACKSIKATRSTRKD